MSKTALPLRRHRRRRPPPLLLREGEKRRRRRRASTKKQAVAAAAAAAAVAVVSLQWRCLGATNSRSNRTGCGGMTWTATHWTDTSAGVLVIRHCATWIIWDLPVNSTSFLSDGQIWIYRSGSSSGARGRQSGGVGCGRRGMRGRRGWRRQGWQGWVWKEKTMTTAVAVATPQWGPMGAPCVLCAS